MTTFDRDMHLCVKIDFLSNRTRCIPLYTCSIETHVYEILVHFVNMVNKTVKFNKCDSLVTILIKESKVAILVCTKVSCKVLYMYHFHDLIFAFIFAESAVS